MLTELLATLNNWFVKTLELGEYTFEVTGEVYTISGSFGEDYIVGQYISIDGSKLNDGVYKITAVETGVLTVDLPVIDEVVDVALWGLAVPKVIVDLATEIQTYKTQKGQGIVSESQGSRSVSYADGSWVGVYRTRIAPYRKLYSDKKLHSARCPNWQNR